MSAHRAIEQSRQNAHFALHRARLASHQEAGTRLPEDVMREAAAFAQEAAEWFLDAADRITMLRAEDVSKNTAAGPH